MTGLDEFHRVSSAEVRPRPLLFSKQELTPEEGLQWIKTATIVSVVVYGATKLGWGAVGFGVALLGVWYTKRSLESLKVDYQEDAVRRGNVVEGGESVEWLNEFVALVWPMLNRELFVAGVDLLEDALKVQSPSIVRTVRIASVDQGSNPMRLLSVRRLPPETPITLPPSLSHPPSSSSTKKSDAKDLDPDAVTDGGGGEVQDGDEPGAYVNIEVEFAYRRPPPSKTKVPNIHFLLYLGVGVKKVAKVDLPVLIELSGVKGKIKLRFQMIPEPPFVRHVTFSFPTLPEIEVSAKPLRSINVMALPVIEPLVLGSVNEVLSEFVAPKSYTIDVSRFVLGSEVDMKTRSCGVVCVVIGRANGLANTDVSGASDPYVTVSFAGVGKVLYSTLVVRNNLDPEWNEIAFLKVSEDEFEEDEKIRLTAFDHDRYSQDDALGCLDIPMKKLQSTPGEFLHSEGALKSPTRTSSKPAQGTLVWRAGFFPLARTTPKIKSYKTNTDDLNPELVDMPEDLITPHKTRKMFTDRSHPEDSRSTQYARRMREMLDGRHPADRGQKTGILAFKVHQIAGLGLSGRKRSLPSSYCAVFLNDEKAFQTRVKPLSSNPYFNAGSEAICPDWLTSTLTVAVMESRDRDHDRILGLVSLDLKDLLSQRCQWTRWYRINQGAGVGRLRLSVLFRPLDIELHHSLLSWSLGTLEVSSIKITGLQTHFEGQVRIATEDWSETAGVEEPEVAATGENSLLVTLPRPIQVPVTDHRRGRLTLTLEEPHSITHNKGKAFASIHVSEIHGLTPVTLSVPLQRSPAPPHRPLHLPTCPSNCKSTSRTSSTSKHALSSPAPHSSPTAYGTLSLTARWVPGISPAHKDVVLTQGPERAAYQLWLHRSDVGESGEKEGGKGKEKERKGEERKGEKEGGERIVGEEEEDLWVEDEEGEPSAEGTGTGRKLKKWDEERRVRGLGTINWLAHGVKIATRKVKASTKHRTKAPKTEEEVHSSF